MIWEISFVELFTAQCFTFSIQIGIIDVLDIYQPRKLNELENFAVEDR